MCSSCGKSAAKLPGANPNVPIIFGANNKGAAQPATFLVDHDKTQAGQYRYVSGDGIEQAVADGIIEIGYSPNRARRKKPAPTIAQSPEWYVKTGNNKWVGFKTKPAAERYAKTIGATVQTSDEVLQLRSAP